MLFMFGCLRSCPGTVAVATLWKPYPNRRPPVTDCNSYATMRTALPAVAFLALAAPVPAPRPDIAADWARLVACAAVVVDATQSVETSALAVPAAFDAIGTTAATSGAGVQHLEALGRAVGAVGDYAEAVNGLLWELGRMSQQLVALKHPLAAADLIDDRTLPCPEVTQ